MVASTSTVPHVFPYDALEEGLDKRNIDLIHRHMPHIFQGGRTEIANCYCLVYPVIACQLEPGPLPPGIPQAFESASGRVYR